VSLCTWLLIVYAWIVGGNRLVDRWKEESLWRDSRKGGSG
jgi:hypothetical protein